MPWAIKISATSDRDRHSELLDVRLRDQICASLRSRINTVRQESLLLGIRGRAVAITFVAGRHDDSTNLLLPARLEHLPGAFGIGFKSPDRMRDRCGDLSLCR